MKIAIHGRRPPPMDGKRDERAGEPWCGARSSKVDEWGRVTCERCVRLKTKRTWVTR